MIWPDTKEIIAPAVITVEFTPLLTITSAPDRGIPTVRPEMTVVPAPFVIMALTAVPFADPLPEAAEKVNTPPDTVPLGEDNVTVQRTVDKLSKSLSNPFPDASMVVITP